MNKKRELIFQALGAASMCWTGAPSGEFDSTRCKEIGDKLMADLETDDSLSRALNANSLKDRIRNAINCCSRENESNTPDFILAEYLLSCLAAFESASLRREKWYGKKLSIN